MVTQTNSNLLAPLIGQTARGCWLGYGSVLFLEFGQPQPLRDREEHARGEYGLSCEHVQWRIEQRNEVCAGSEDDRNIMAAGIGRLDEKTLVSADLLPTGDSILIFSDDLVLRTFVITSEDNARWTYRNREGKYFMVGPDRAYPEEQLPSQDIQALR